MLELLMIYLFISSDGNVVDFFCIDRRYRFSNYNLSPRRLSDSIGLPFHNVSSLIKQHLGGNIAGTLLPHCNFSELAICRRPWIGRPSMLHILSLGDEFSRLQIMPSLQADCLITKSAMHQHAVHGSLLR